mmetsp:Transcript_43009/g.106089  ORF Transcript_43009/g.106089 Transcript_43009/m.106089 type:complete len:175 (-) Transcript_43009:433-957(-)
MSETQYMDQTGPSVASGSTRKDMKSIAHSSYRPLPSEEYMYRLAAQEADSIKHHTFSGASGHSVLVDIKEPKPKAFGLGVDPETEVFYRTSNANFGVLASQIDPISGLNKLTGQDTGILYKSTAHVNGLNGRFTAKLAQAGFTTEGGLNTTLTKSRTVANPQQWGASAYALRFA